MAKPRPKVKPSNITIKKAQGGLFVTMVTKINVGNGPFTTWSDREQHIVITKQSDLIRLFESEGFLSKLEPNITVTFHDEVVE